MNRPIHGGNVLWAASLVGCPPSSILDFSASINPFGPPQSAIAAIQAGLKELVVYPDPNYSRLRQVLGELHQLSSEWILPGNGAAELLTWAAWELAQQPVTYLLTPAFGDYYRALNAFQGKICSTSIFSECVSQNIDPNLNQFRCSLPVVEKSLLLNNPHNPTGMLWTREEILPLLDRCELVVIDEAFMDFLPPNQQQSLIPKVQDYPNLVILRSLTKFYSLPGLRLGYAIAHPDRLRQWQQWRDPWPVNVLAAAAGIAVIGDTSFQQQTWNWLPSARLELFEGLASLPGLNPLPGSANFLLVKTDRSSVQLQSQLLQKHHILIRDCLSFPELGDRYFRVAVRSPQDNQQLLAGLEDILLG